LICEVIILLVRSETVKEPVTLTLSPEVITRLDENRGVASRSAFAQLLLEKALDAGYSYTGHMG
jgi:hypothetical protein